MRTIVYFQSAYCECNDAEIHGVFRWARKAQWNVQVIPYAEAAASRLQTKQDERGVPPVGKLVDFWRPEGAIVDCGAAVGLLKPADFGTLPVVFLDCSTRIDGVAVRSDSGAIGESAARELLSLGFPNYAFVPWIEPLGWSRERGDVFVGCVRLNSLPCHCFSWNAKTKSEVSMRRQLTDWLGKLPLPVAVFAANDYLASLLVSSARSLQLRLPDDVAVLGVDNDARICELSSPTISSVCPDFEGAGYRAATLLEEMIRNPGARPKDVYFGVERIVRRESTRRTLRSDHRVDPVVDYIRKSAHEGITPASVAARMGCSRRLLEMRFREMTGHTILDEIRAARTERAKRILSTTDSSIEDVARECGYEDVGTFRRAFARETGVTPLNYRKHGGDSKPQPR